MDKEFFDQFKQEIPEGSKMAQTFQNILDTTNHIEPERIPIMADFYGWPFDYAGVRYDELHDQPEKAAEEYCKFLDVIDFDTLFVAGLSQPAYAFQKIGLHQYVVGEDGNTIMHNQADDVYFGPEVYDEIIADPFKFMNETLVRFKIPAYRLPKEQAYEAVKESAKELGYFLKINGLISAKVAEKKQAYNIMGCPVTYFEPFQDVFMKIRGIKDSLADLRRRPEKVRAACDAMMKVKMAGWIFEPEYFSDPLPFALTGYHPQCFLSPKWFDELFFQDLKKLMMPFVEKGKKLLVMTEGDNTRTMERYLEFPDHSVTFLLDKENPFEMKKLYGDKFSFIAGMPVDLLATGTKEQCVDHVKKCFDELAPGGGFIFGGTSPLMNKKDSKIENVIAVYETANDLAKK